MILDANLFRGRKHGALAIQPRGVETHAHIGDEGAEHEHEIGGLHIIADLFVTTHGAAVDAEVQRMVLRHGALAQEIGGDRNVGALRHSHDQMRAAIAG
jgi:hypothetical protein